MLQVPGSVASHQAALALHRVPNVPFGVSITVASTGRSSRHGIQVHRFGDLLPEHLVTVDGIPTTSLPRAVVDVSSQFGRSRLAHLIDHPTIKLLLEIDGGAWHAREQAMARDRARDRAAVMRDLEAAYAARSALFASISH